MTVVTFETIKHLADQLSLREQARLIEHLSRRLAVAVPPQTYETESPPVADDAWKQFFAVCADIRTTYPHANLIRRLETDRQERDAALWGVHREQDDVHA
jgi:hypothetical protein